MILFWNRISLFPVFVKELLLVSAGHRCHHTFSEFVDSNEVRTFAERDEIKC